MLIVGRRAPGRKVSRERVTQTGPEDARAPTRRLGAALPRAARGRRRRRCRPQATAAPSTSARARSTRNERSLALRTDCARHRPPPHGRGRLYATKAAGRLQRSQGLYAAEPSHASAALACRRVEVREAPPVAHPKILFVATCATLERRRRRNANEAVTAAMADRHEAAIAWSERRRRPRRQHGGGARAPPSRGSPRRAAAEEVPTRAARASRAVVARAAGPTAAPSAGDERVAPRAAGAPPPAAATRRSPSPRRRRRRFLGVNDRTKASVEEPLGDTLRRNRARPRARLERRRRATRRMSSPRPTSLRHVRSRRRSRRSTPRGRSGVPPRASSPCWRPGRVDGDRRAAGPPRRRDGIVDAARAPTMARGCSSTRPRDAREASTAASTRGRSARWATVKRRPQTTSRRRRARPRRSCRARRQLFAAPTSPTDRSRRRSRRLESASLSPEPRSRRGVTTVCRRLTCARRRFAIRDHARARGDDRDVIGCDRRPRATTRPSDDGEERDEADAGTSCGAGP